MTDCRAAVVAVMVAARDPAMTVSEIMAETKLPRNQVVTEIAALADEQRAMRDIAEAVDGLLVVRWTLRR